MNIFEYIKEVDSKDVDDLKLIWDWGNGYKYDNHAFVIYDNNGRYVDSLDPISKIYITDQDIYIEHGNQFLGLFIVNRGEIRESNLNCHIERAHFAYEADRVVTEDLEWLIDMEEE